MSVKLKRINGELIAEGESLIKLIAENLADLRYADLSSADLNSANLRHANLSYADLSYADLSSADLNYADLSSADLNSANLRHANLSYTDLSYTDLSYANFSYADLRSADLSYADLSSADLRSADLRYADLREVKNGDYAFSITMICPPEGAFIAWKKCANGVIVKLQIPTKAKRSNATGRKCRAEFVKVLEVIGAEKGLSLRDGETEYCKGNTVKCDKWDENRWEECSGGIHFFLTRIEAEEYN